MNTIKHITRVCVLTMLSFVACAQAFADSVIYLANGGQVVGDIIREEEQFIIVRVTTGGAFANERVIFRADIDRIEGDTAGASTDETSDLPDIPDDAARIAFFTLGDTLGGLDMVGPYVNTEALEQSLDILRELPGSHRPDTVVLIMDSGGGALYEMLKLTEFLHEEREERGDFRIVVWIRSAISAAAMTSWAVPEIYMTPKGHIGACTGFRSTREGAIAMVGQELYEVMDYMKDVSIWGEHHYAIMWAMQVSAPDYPFALSVEENPDTGELTWHYDQLPYGAPYNGDGSHLPGKLISPYDEVLTFNATESVRYGVAQGIASTKDELAQLMGYSEWVEVGHEAEDHQVAHRKIVGEASGKIRVHFESIERALSYAQSTVNNAEWKRYLSRAKRDFRQLKRMSEDHQAIAFYEGLSEERLNAWQDWIRAIEGLGPPSQR